MIGAVLTCHSPSLAMNFPNSGFPLEIKYALIIASNTKSFRGNRIEVETTVRIARENQCAFLNDVRSITPHNGILGNPHKPLQDQLPEVTTHLLVISLKGKPRGYGLFLGLDTDSHHPEIYQLTYTAHNHDQATAVAKALGTTFRHKLREIIWRSFTEPYK